METTTMTSATRERAASTKEEWNEFSYTGPGTLAGRYLRMFWQPVYVAEDLPVGRPKPVRVMSEDFTLYRGESGEAHLVDFRCAHRGTQLNVGWVEGEEIRCRYHGWKFGPDGRCTEQPGEPEPFCEKIRIKSYPTREYLGLVFAYLGEGDPPEFPRYTALEGNGVLLVTWEIRECNFFNNLENDPIHTFFTHYRTHRSWRNGLPKNFKAEETPYGLTAGRNYILMPNITYRPNLQHRPASKPQWDGKDATKLVDERGNIVGWKLPIDDVRHHHIQVEWFPHGERADRYIQRRKEWLAKQTLSVDEVSEKIFRGEMQLDDIPIPDGEGADVHWLNVLEDTATQCGQGAIADRTAEHLGRTDMLVILLRKVWQRELQALAERRPLTKWIPPEWKSEWIAYAE
jgi:5,5'-dehydrodivanillate O-demethylase